MILFYMKCNQEEMCRSSYLCDVDIGAITHTMVGVWKVVTRGCKFANAGEDKRYQLQMHRCQVVLSTRKGLRD